MADRKQNIVLGTFFLLLSGVWTWFVVTTIPAGYGQGDIGPRAFPLIFGISLGFLSAILILKAIFAVPNNALDFVSSQGIRWLPAGLVLVEICAYGYLLKTCGFVIATPIVILFVMLVNLRIRSPKLLLGMSIGCTVACWLIFEKALGIYLANGSWINLG